MPHCQAPWSSRLLRVFPADGQRMSTIFGNQVGGDFAQFGPPAISASGSQIAFSAWTGDGADTGVFVTGLRHWEEPTRLGDGTFLQWSPDGAWLLFARSTDDESTSELWLVRPDGGAAHQLSTFASFLGQPAW